MTSSLHWRTPSLAVIDGRGLPIRQVAYLRSAVGATPSALVTTRQHDLAARHVAQQDPRLPMANATDLMESAGKKEIAMMVPLVFGVLPLTVLFSIFPGISLLGIGL